MNRVFQGVWPGGWIIRWRNLTWKEFTNLRYSQKSDIERYVDVYRLCLVSGPAPDAAPAGIVDWIGKQQLTKSPFTGSYQNLQAALDAKREWLNSSFLQVAKATVAWVFRYSFEEIDSWDPDTFFERLVSAEYLLGKEISPADPKADPALKPTPSQTKSEALRAENKRKRAEVEERRIRWSSGK